MSAKRRNKLEIFNDILTGINDETTNGEVKPTRIAHIANMSYDKLAKYLDELKEKHLIINSPLVLTEKGKKFLQDYERIHDFVVQMKLEYIDEKNHSSSMEF